MLGRHFPTTLAEERQAFASLLEPQAPLLKSYYVRGETPAEAIAGVVGVMRTLLNRVDGA
jgi:hypothetical protein